SGLQVCSPPRSSLPLRILPQGSRGFYVRAERGSLPPRASDMLTARRQAIGGAGTSTPLDCGLVGCSPPGWDRNWARPAVGEGFPVLLFRLQTGSQSHHGVRFSTPP